MVVALGGGHDEVADESDLVAESRVHEIVPLVKACHVNECRKVDRRSEAQVAVPYETFNKSVRVLYAVCPI